jgi:predicted nucleic acid-binding protein
VVDCNVVVALYFDSVYSESARSLLRLDPDWHSEPTLLIEFVNVMATLMRVRQASWEAAATHLTAVQALMKPSLHAAPDQDTLQAAHHFRISGYDARYIVVARALGTRLVTEDRRLRLAAPDYTCSLDDALTA